MNILNCYLPADFEVGQTGYIIGYEEDFRDEKLLEQFPIGTKVTIVEVKQRHLNEYCCECNNSSICKQCIEAINEDGKEINNCIALIDKVYR